MKVTGGVQLLIKLGLASSFKPVVSVLYSKFLLIIYFIYTSVYILMPISSFIPVIRPLSPLVTISLFSKSVSLFLVCK